MSESITIARPYAKAAFDYASEHHQISHWQHMLSFSAAVSVNAKMRNLFSSDMKSNVLADLFISVCEGKLDRHGQNFIRILAENKRLVLLPEVVVLFEAYCAEQDAVADVEVLSAKKLTKIQMEKIAAATQRRLSCKVKLTNKIDKSLISGFIIRADDLVIDSSIKGRLERLTDALQS